jgi:hypothetical protein
MRVRVLRALWYAGEMRKPGEEMDFPDQMAREAIHIGKVERVTAEAKPQAGPMTTATAPELTGAKKSKGAQ